MKKENFKKIKNDGLVDHMKVNLIIYDSLGKSRALHEKISDPLWLKGLFYYKYLSYFFSQLSDIFLPEKVSEIYRLSSFSAFLSIADQA